jgi:hypothetical protein
MSHKTAADRIRERTGANGTHQPPRPEDLILEPPPPPVWPAPPRPEAFHGLAGEVVAAVEPETEADPVAILVQFLAGFGNACGRTAYGAVGPRRHHGNLYAVLVGTTARGRKGTAWSWVEHLLGAADPDWLRDRVRSGLSSGEGLIHALRDLEGGGTDKRLLAIEEEFANVLRVALREGNILSGVLRKAFDSGNLCNLTRNNPLTATDTHVSLIGHVTRQELLAVMGKTEAFNGFAPRFLWACVRRSKLLPDGGGFPELRPLAVRVQYVLRTAAEAGRFTRDAAARKLWHDEYPRLVAERPGLFGVLSSRAEVHVLRLSLVYALLDDAVKVRVEHLRAALAVWDYCERSLAYVFGDSTGNDMADQLRQALEAAGDLGMTGREIHGLFSRNATAKEIGEALGILRDAGEAEARVEATGKRGKPPTKWYWVLPATNKEQKERNSKS